MTDWDWPDSTVVRVIDGDSLIVMVHRDLGFHGLASYQVRIRLNRINAPKLTTDAGKAARGALSIILGTTVYFHLVTVGPYKYGDEWMGEITLATGENVSDLMVTQGHAVYWDGLGPRPADG